MHAVPVDWDAPGDGDAAGLIEAHTVAAERLEAGLDTLLGAVEAALAAAGDAQGVLVDADGLTRDERAVVEGSTFARAELGVVAASYDALHPSRDA